MTTSWCTVDGVNTGVLPPQPPGPSLRTQTTPSSQMLLVNKNHTFDNQTLLLSAAPTSVPQYALAVCFVLYSLRQVTVG